MTGKVDRRFSPVVRTIWSHPKFADLTKPKPNAQTLVLRLLIPEEGTSIPGLYRALEAGIAQQLDWTLKSFRAKFKEASEAGWVVADWKRGVVWVPSAIEQDANQPANPNVVRGWKQLIAEIPDCDLKHQALAKFEAWAKAKGEKWFIAWEEALGKRPPMRSPNPSGKGKPKDSPKGQPKALVKGKVKGSPIQEQEQEQEASKLAKHGGLAGKFQERPRAPGEPPLPRKDILNKRLPFARWFPSQQWLDWAKESGIGDQLFDQTLAEARDKLTGAHDIEWWDIKILSFFESALKRAGKQATTAQGPVVSP